MVPLTNTCSNSNLSLGVPHLESTNLRSPGGGQLERYREHLKKHAAEEEASGGDGTPAVPSVPPEGPIAPANSAPATVGHPVPPFR
jgi:hypothetical protein